MDIEKLLEEIGRVEEKREKAARIADWVQVTPRKDKWDVRLYEGDGGWMLVFIDLPRREIADEFAGRIRKSLRGYALALIDEWGL